MKDLGLMHYLLGLVVWQKPCEIFLSQGKYIVKLFERFGMVDCKFVTTPIELNFKKLCGSAARPDLGNLSEYRQLAGALMFLVNSHLDICFASIYGRASSHTLDCCQESLEISSRHNHLWIEIHYREFEAPWKQKLVALSTAEAEYIATSMASCEVVWLRKLFSELFGHVLDTTVIYYNNQRGLRLSENPVFHDRSKHIDIRYHFILDMVQRGIIRQHHIGTDEQVADILTKPLGKVKFLTFRERLGVVEKPSYEGLV
eukprot:PITA_14945